MDRRMLIAAVLLGGVAASIQADASSHREAPFVTRHPKVDGTDFYMFRSYESGRDGFVTVIANYAPLQDSYGGPNFFTMDPDALYEVHFDTTGDAVEDLTLQFRFKNSLKGGNGFTLPIGPAGMTKDVAIPLNIKGAVSGWPSANLNVEETYGVKLVRGLRRSGSPSDVTSMNGGANVFTKPADNIGQKTISDYEAYARQFRYDVNIPGCATPGRIFVGQRKDPFVVNLGRIFDLINFNPVTGQPSVDDLRSKNVTSLIVEFPIACFGLQNGNTTVGAWTTASLRQATVLNPRPTFDRPQRAGGAWVQVSRLGMPLVNEVVIGLKDKDRFNSSQPKDDPQFLDYVTHPTLPALIEIIHSAVAPKTFPRNDLVAVFLTGVAGVNQIGANPTPGEMLRLNTAVAPKLPADQKAIGAAGCFGTDYTDVTLGSPNCDAAGFPNGRRPGDDIVDIALRVVMGALLPADATNNPTKAAPLTDGANVSASDFDGAFPYLRTPLPGSTAIN